MPKPRGLWYRFEQLGVREIGVRSLYSQML